MRVSSCAVGTLLLAQLFALPGAAQVDSTVSVDDSFSSFDVSAGWVHGHPGREDPDAWDGAGGWAARLSAPYLGGRIFAVGERSWYRARRSDLGDLRELWTALGWEIPVLSVGPLAIGASANLGAVRWHLPQEDNPNETEMAAGLAASLRWSLLERWWMVVDLGRRWTFTEPTIRRDVWTVSVGRTVDLRPAIGRWLGQGATVTGDAERPLAALPRPARLFERLAVLTEVELASVDAMSLQLAAGAGPFSPGPWRTRVDDAEIVLAAPGPFVPDLLPVDPTAVAEVRVAPDPAWRTGVLEVALRTIPEGWSGGGWGRGSNASGDPGPHLLLGVGRNVESLEWGVGGTIGFRQGQLVLRGEGTRHRRWVSQGPVFERNFEVVDRLQRWPFLDVAKGALSAHIERGGWSWSLRAGRGELEDFLLVPGAPRELPTLRAVQHGHLGVRRVGASDDTLGLSFDATRDTLQTTANVLDRSFGWRVGDTSVRLWRRTSGLGLEMEAGRRTQSGVPTPTDRADGRGRLTAVLRPTLGGARIELASSLLRADGRWGEAASASARVPAGGWSMHGELYWERLPPALAAPALWRHGAIEGELLDAWGLEGATIAVADEVRRLGLVGTVERPRATSSVRFSAQIEALDGPLFERAAIRHLRTKVPEATAPLVVDRGRGTSALLRAGLTWRGGPLSGEGSWSVRSLLGGNEPYERAHGALPRHRLLHHLLWRPRGDLDLAASAELTSATRWEGYATDAAPAGRLDGRATLQIAIRKRAWDDRLEAGVTLLDLADQGVPRHPLGAAPGLTMIVSCTLRLGGR